MWCNLYVAFIIALFHTCVGMDKAQLKEYRKNNEKTYQEYMNILHDRIVDGVTDPNRIEWLSTISILFTIDREVILSLRKVSFPTICMHSVDKTFSQLEKRNSVTVPGAGKRAIVNSTSMELLQTVKEYNDKIVALKDDLESYEFNNHIAYSSYKDFFMLLNSTSTVATKYEPSSLVAVNKILSEEYAEIVKCRKKITDKIEALMDAIDYNIHQASLEVYIAMESVYRSVTQFYESNIDVEINKMILDLKPNIKVLKGLLGNKVFKNFNLNDEFKRLENSENKLSQSFMETLIPKPGRSPNGKSPKSGSPKTGSIQNSPRSGMLPKFLQTTLFSAEINPAKLIEYRDSNAKNFDAFSVILQDKISAGFSGSKHLDTDRLAELMIILTLDHEMYLSFNIRLPGYIEEYLERILNSPLKDKVTVETSKVLKDLQGYAMKVKDLNDILDDKEWAHYKGFELAKPVYDKIKDTIKTRKGFRSEPLAKYQKLLKENFEKVKKMRQAIVEKTQALRHVIDKEIRPLELEVNVILAKIYNAILMQEPELLEVKKKLVEKELAPKVVKLKDIFAKSTAIKDFVKNINNDIIKLEEAEKPLNEAFYGLTKS